MRGSAELYAVFTAVMFSLTEVVSRQLEGVFTPEAVGGVRFLIGSLVLLPFALPRLPAFLRNTGTAEKLKLAGTGVLHVSISMTALQLAVWYGHAALTALLISASPLFAALFERLLFKVKLSAAQYYGLLIGLTGICLIIYGKPVQQQAARAELPGLLFGLLASVTFALSTVLQKQFVMRHGPLLTSSLCFLSGSAVHLTVVALFGLPAMTAALTPVTAAWLLLLGAGISGIAYLAFFRAMRRLSAARASAFLYLKPGLAALFAAVLLGERTSLLQLAGFVVVLAGLHWPRLLKLLRRSTRQKRSISGKEF